MGSERGAQGVSGGWGCGPGTALHRTRSLRHQTARRASGGQAGLGVHAGRSPWDQVTWSRALGVSGASEADGFLRITSVKA